MEKQIGPIAVLGSGETSLAGGRIFEAIAQKYPEPMKIAILETPAGFELNSSRVAGRVGEYMETRLQNYHPQIELVPARNRNSQFSPDNPEILKPLLQADMIFMGPGSPTYAVRQLAGSLAWDLVRARHRMGAALVFASAAVIALGACVLPVYEIYKVGEDVNVLPGLDLFADFQLPVSVIPHWNNTDGGDEVDTSRCFVGIERFKQWCNLLPKGQTIIGLDEHTGVIINFDTGKCNVSGVSSVTLLRDCDPEIYPSGAEFALSELGGFKPLSENSKGISKQAWEMIENSENNKKNEEPPDEVMHLVEARQQARSRQDWASSDSLRDEISAKGWIVQDTPNGQKIFKQA
jgi:cyanophycinase-like exopeptidase